MWGSNSQSKSRFSSSPGSYSSSRHVAYTAVNTSEDNSKEECDDVNDERTFMKLQVGALLTRYMVGNFCWKM